MRGGGREGEREGMRGGGREGRKEGRGRERGRERWIMETGEVRQELSLYVSGARGGRGGNK